MRQTELQTPFITREYLEVRLKEAGSTILCTPESLGPTGYHNAWPDIVHDAMTAYGWEAVTVRLPRQSKQRVDEMNEVLDWLQLLNGHEKAIVMARMLWHPYKIKPVISWYKISRFTGLHKHTCKRYYDAALDRLVGRVNGFKKVCP
jgi:hypothetical protein